MKKDDHYLLGSLLKTSGIKGEIVLKFNNDCPEGIQKLESIFIDVDNKLVPFFIEHIRIKSNNTAVVKLEGLNDELKVFEFIGSEFYISYQHVDLLQIDNEEYIDVVGYQVHDQTDKLIGEVVEFLEIPKNPLLNVKTKKGEVLIPVKDELIIDILDDEKIIKLEVSEGIMYLD